MELNEIEMRVDEIRSPPKRRSRSRAIRRRTVAIMAIIVGCLVITASAALLPYFGKVATTATVSQSLLVDGESMPTSDDITDGISGVACNLLLGARHTLTNNADKKIIVDLVSTETGWPAGGAGGLESKYPEYRLDARAEENNEDDDAFFVKLGDNIVWKDFTGISFDYLIIGDGGEKWIPQTNIVLRDGEGNGKYYVSWNSFRTGITGIAGTRSSITQQKGDFYVYSIPDWGLLGLWKDLSQEMKIETNQYQFGYFTLQAGDTSYPNDQENEGMGDEIVWVSNIDTDGDITGIVVPDVSYGTLLRNLEFRMLYVFSCLAYEGDYTIVTKVNYVGTL